MAVFLLENPNPVCRAEGENQGAIINRNTAIGLYENRYALWQDNLREYTGSGGISAGLPLRCHWKPLNWRGAALYLLGRAGRNLPHLKKMDIMKATAAIFLPCAKEAR